MENIYTTEEIQILQKLLSKGISELERIREIATYSLKDIERIKFTGAPSDQWFNLLNYAKDLEGEDYIQKIIDNSLDVKPENKYLVKAKKLD